MRYKIHIHICKSSTIFDIILTCIKTPISLVTIEIYIIKGNEMQF